MSIQVSDGVPSRRAARRVRKCLSCIDPPVVIVFLTGRPTPCSRVRSSRWTAADSGHRAERHVRKSPSRGTSTGPRSSSQALKGRPTSEICRRHAALCLANTVLIIGKLLTWRDRYSPRSLP